MSVGESKKGRGKADGEKLGEGRVKVQEKLVNKRKKRGEKFGTDGT